MWFENVVIILTWLVISLMYIKRCIKNRKKIDFVVISLSVVSFVAYLIQKIICEQMSNIMQFVLLFFMYIVPIFNLYVYYNNIAIKQKIVCLLGKLYYNMGRYDVAAKLYTYSIKTNRKNMTAENYYILGRCLRKEKRYLDARDMFIEVVEQEKNNFMAYYELGLTLEESGKKDTAIVMFSNALKINPDFVEAKTALAITYSEIDRYKEAIALYEEIIQNEMANEEVYYNLGNIYYYKQGETKKAEECYLKATNISPKLYVAWFNIGIINYLKGDYMASVNALEMSRQSLELKDKSDYNLAKSYAAIKENTKAIKILTKLLARNEEYTEKIKEEIVFEEILSEIFSEKNEE